MSNLKKKFKKKVITYTDQIWIPKNIKKVKNKNSESWFDIKETYYTDKKKFPNIKNIKKNVDEYIKCNKYQIIPNKKQKKILLRWLECYIKMYNETLRFIRKMEYTNNDAQFNKKRRTFNKKKRLFQERKRAFNKIKTLHDREDRKLLKMIENFKNNKNKLTINIRKKRIDIIRQKKEEFNKTKKIYNKKLEKYGYYKHIFDKKEKKFNAIKKKHNKIMKDFYNSKTLRTKYMKEIRNDIQKKSCIKDDYNTRMLTHILDGAIKDVCTSYKSAFTNLRNGNIRHFKIRYIKQKKKKKVMSIGNENFSKKFNVLKTKMANQEIMVE